MKACLYWGMYPTSASHTCQVFRGSTSPRRTGWGGGGAGASGRFIHRPDGSLERGGGAAAAAGALSGGQQQGGLYSPTTSAAGGTAASGALRPSTAATYAQAVTSTASSAGFRLPHESCLRSNAAVMLEDEAAGLPPPMRHHSMMRASAPSLGMSDLAEPSASSFSATYQLHLPLLLPQQPQQPLQQPRPARLALAGERSLPDLLKSSPLSPNLPPWRGFSQNPFVAPPPLYPLQP